MRATAPAIPAREPGPSGGTDAAAIEESLAQPERFAALYDRYAAALHRYAARRVGADVADDLVAATFLAAFGGRARYDLTRPARSPASSRRRLRAASG